MLESFYRKRPLPAFIIHKKNAPAAGYRPDSAESELLLKPGYPRQIVRSGRKEEAIILSAMERELERSLFVKAESG